MLNHVTRTPVKPLGSRPVNTASATPTDELKPAANVRAPALLSPRPRPISVQRSFVARQAVRTVSWQAPPRLDLPPELVRDPALS